MYTLYLKTHNVTGLKYLGYTSKDPHLYKGSGTYWKRHIKQHGYNVNTEVLQTCETKEEISKYGLEFSRSFDVVHSEDFANLIEETGDGGDTSKTENFINSIKSRDLTIYKWWTNGIQSIKAIKPPAEDWYRGNHTMINNKRSLLGAAKQRGKKWYNNGIEEKMSHPSTIDKEWNLGRLDPQKFNPPGKKLGTGTHWFNDGKVSIMAFEPPNDSFKPGRIYSRSFKAA